MYKYELEIVCCEAAFNQATYEQANYDQATFAIKLPVSNNIERIRVATSNYERL